MRKDAIVSTEVICAVYRLQGFYNGHAPATLVNKTVNELFGKTISHHTARTTLRRLFQKGILGKGKFGGRLGYYLKPEYLSPVDMKNIMAKVNGESEGGV